MFAVFFVVMIHGVVDLLNSMRHTITADYQGLTIRRRWTKLYMPWQDVRLFWYVAPYFPSAPIPASAAFTAAGAPLGSYELASAKHSVTISAEAINLRFDDPATYPTRLREILATAVRLSNVPLRQASRQGVLTAARQSPFAWVRPSRPMRVRIIRFQRFCKTHNNMIALTLLPPLFLIPLTATTASGWLFSVTSTSAQAQVVAVHPCVGKKDSAGEVTLVVQYLDPSGQQRITQAPSCVVHPEHVGDMITIRYKPDTYGTIQTSFETKTSGPLFGLAVGGDIFVTLIIAWVHFQKRRQARAATAAKQQVAQRTTAS